MTQQILVVLKRRQRLEALLPYLQRIARPGMQVLFLIPDPIDAWTWWRDHWLAGDSARAVMAAARDVLAKYSGEALKRRAELRIAAARQALGARGVSVSVQVFAGGLSAALRNCAPGGEAQLVIRRQGEGIAMNLYGEEGLSLESAGATGGSSRASAIAASRLSVRDAGLPPSSSDDHGN